MTTDLQKAWIICVQKNAATREVAASIAATAEQTQATISAIDSYPQIGVLCLSCSDSFAAALKNDARIFSVDESKSITPAWFASQPAP